MNEHQPMFVQQAVGQISNRVDKLYSTVGWADARKPNIFMRQMLGFLHLPTCFEVKIEYTDISPEQFTAKMQGFNINLDILFTESKDLETEIKKQLAGIEV